MEIKITLIQNNVNIVKEFGNTVDAVSWLTSLTPKKEAKEVYEPLTDVAKKPTPPVEYPNTSGDSFLSGGPVTSTFGQPVEVL